MVPRDIFYPCFDIFYQIFDRNSAILFALEEEADEEEESSEVINLHNLEILWKPIKRKTRTGKIIGYRDLALTNRILNAYS